MNSEEPIRVGDETSEIVRCICGCQFDRRPGTIKPCPACGEIEELHARVEPGGMICKD